MTTSTPAVADSTRVSTNPFGGLLIIPSCGAVINHPGGVGCATVPASSGWLVGLLGGVAALAGRRRA